MNPVFILLVVCALVVLWFLLAFLFKPIGWLVKRIFKDAVDEMKDEEEGEKTKNE